MTLWFLYSANDQTRAKTLCPSGAAPGRDKASGYQTQLNSSREGLSWLHDFTAHFADARVWLSPTDDEEGGWLLCPLVNPQQRILLTECANSFFIKGLASFPSVRLSSQGAAQLGCQNESIRCFAVDFLQGCDKKDPCHGHKDWMSLRSHKAGLGMLLVSSFLAPNLTH